MCGTVAVEVEGEPVAMGICHCKNRRTWSASPVNGFAVWPIGNMTVSTGEDQIASYTSSKDSERAWCKTCGGHIYHIAGPLGVVDVYAGLVEGLEFKPGLYMNYESTIMPMKGGLPKVKDFPEDFGGSGETLPE
tara:strand:- start:127 stop:528 length:402 start_codon:yes stop_codon:yes gene_type:complete